MGAVGYVETFAANSSRRLLHDAESQMSRGRGLDHLGCLKMYVLVTDVLEHSGAAAEQHWHKVDEDLVD